MSSGVERNPFEGQSVVGSVREAVADPELRLTTLQKELLIGYASLEELLQLRDLYRHGQLPHESVKDLFDVTGDGDVRLTGDSAEELIIALNGIHTLLERAKGSYPSSERRTFWSHIADIIVPVMEEGFYPESSYLPVDEQQVKQARYAVDPNRVRIREGGAFVRLEEASAAIGNLFADPSGGDGLREDAKSLVNSAIKNIYPVQPSK